MCYTQRVLMCAARQAKASHHRNSLRRVLVLCAPRLCAACVSLAQVVNKQLFPIRYKSIGRPATIEKLAGKSFHIPCHLCNTHTVSQEKFLRCCPSMDSISKFRKGNATGTPLPPMTTGTLVPRRATTKDLKVNNRPPDPTLLHTRLAPVRSCLQATPAPQLGDPPSACPLPSLSRARLSFHSNPPLS